jgi:hypothetical protein
MSTVSFAETNQYFIIENNADNNTENVENVENTENTENVENNKVENKNKFINYSSHTKFCIFGLNKCRKGSKCIYAHTFKQLNPILCKWDSECLRKEKCYFKHSNESKAQYVIRAFPEDLKRLNIVLFEQPEFKVNKIDNKILIKEEKIDSNIPFSEECKKMIKDLYLKYYDPSFDWFSWADINEFVDSDDEDY